MSLPHEKTLKNSFSGNAAALFLARLFPAMALFLCWIIASHTLPIEAYGNYQRFWIQLSTFSAIAAIGYPTLIFSYPGTSAFGLLHAIPARNRVLYLLAVGVLGITFGCLQIRSGFGLIATCTFIGWVAGTQAEATLLALLKSRLVILINALYALSMIAAHLFLLRQGASLYFVLVWVCVIVALKALFSSVVLLRCHHKCRKDPMTAPHADYASEWRHFAFIDTVQILFRWIDKFILSFLLFENVFAVYINASIDVPFLPILFAAVTGAAVQHWAISSGKDKNDPLPVLHHGAKLLAAMVFPLFGFLMAFRNEFLHVLFSEQYTAGAAIFVCAQLVLPLRAYPFTSLLQIYKRPDIITRGAVIDFFLACALMYPLYRLLGLPGVALAFVTSTYWQAAYYLNKTRQITGIPISQLFPARALAIRLAISLLLFFGTYALVRQFPGSAMQRFLVGTVLLILVAGTSVIREWRKA